MLQQNGVGSHLQQRGWYCIVEQPVPAPHLAHPEGFSTFPIDPIATSFSTFRMDPIATSYRPCYRFWISPRMASGICQMSCARSSSSTTSTLNPNSFQTSHCLGTKPRVKSHRSSFTGLYLHDTRSYPAPLSQILDLSENALKHFLDILCSLTLLCDLNPQPQILSTENWILPPVARGP